MASSRIASAAGDIPVAAIRMNGTIAIPAARGSRNPNEAAPPMLIPADRGARKTCDAAMPV